MTSTPPMLALAPGLASVQDARRWVVKHCRDLGRADLATCAEIGASELVSNALLHGRSPIHLRLAGTMAHPRFEVRDASTQSPLLDTRSASHGNDPVEAAEDELLTFGRGLLIVARCSQAWGADIDADGKVVWFEPAADLDEHDGATPVLTTSTPPSADPETTPTRSYVLQGVPSALHAGFVRHHRQLRREVRLLALAHGRTYPLARDLADLFVALETSVYDGILLAEVSRLGASDPGEPGDLSDSGDLGERADLSSQEDRVDLRLEISQAAASRFSRLAVLFDLADDFCRDESLLSLARDDEQRDFQRWLLAELEAQAAGTDPAPWSHGRGGGSAAPPVPHAHVR